MRFISFLSFLSFFSFLSPVYAYAEYPPFAQTSFAADYGLFRFWEDCWWRVSDPYVYLLCDPNGSVELLYPDGTRVPASQADLERLFGLPAVSSRFSRLSAGRLTPAPGDGIRLSDLYGRFSLSSLASRFNLPSLSGRINLPSLSGRINLPSLDIDLNSLPTGVFTFDGIGSVISTQIDGIDVGNADLSVRTGALDGILNRDGNRFAGNRMADIFYKPIGIRCDNIHDTRDGKLFGPIPCTSYPDVFGPIPKY